MRGHTGTPVHNRLPVSTLWPSVAGEVISVSDDKIERSDTDWLQQLQPEQYNVLRRSGTERAFSNPLNDEKREGRYVCAGCGQELFTSDMKFDSGTGWPSFHTALEDAFETKRDFKLVLPRTEYHCSRCGGHHGHVFDDGPQPSGQRYCNNGVALKFVPDDPGEPDD